ncbi:MAG TPA: hypothetical protein VGK35_12165 [Actinotalea sp.]|jgi:hypothetical protein
MNLPVSRPVHSLRLAARWVRERPAPRWEGGAGGKARFAGHLALSVVGWLGLGLLGTALVSQSLAGLVSLAG